MQNLFTEMLVSNIGIFYTLVVFLIVSLFVLFFKFGKWTEDYKHHRCDLDIIKTKVDSMDSKIINIDSKLARIDGSVRTILNLGYSNTKLAQAHSPMTLTDQGKEISDELNAVDIFNKYSDALINEVESQKPLTAYDIQVAAFNVAATVLPTMLSAIEMEKMKNVAFNKGQILEQMWIIFGIYLRDKVLELRGIPISEVDKK